MVFAMDRIPCRFEIETRVSFDKRFMVRVQTGGPVKVIREPHNFFLSLIDRSGLDAVVSFGSRTGGLRFSKSVFIRSAVSI